MALTSGVTSLPTNYEYYTADGITQGLNANQSFFTLNDKLIHIYSGAMHYFRVPRAYWRDRLKKIRAAGLNTVETYVPWNLHEPEQEKYDFGSGGSEFEDFLHLEEFLNTAKEEDLFVILRTGPYICAEYNFGGFPSWLLRSTEMGFRTAEPTYMSYVTKYFNVLLTLLTAFQFTKGGPIIGFQLENEYGNFNYNNRQTHLEQLRQIFLQNGIVELLMTSDSPSRGTTGTLPGEVLQTLNFGSDAPDHLATLEELQPGRPQMVMEFWVGWYDLVGSGNHARKSDKICRTILTDILERNASFNIYMFHGGTNFAFNNGARYTNGYSAVTTSYDYDAPISESGAYRSKYDMVKELVAAYNPVKTFTPDPPVYEPPTAYESIKIEETISFWELLQSNSTGKTFSSEQLIPMELLNMNNGAGQSNGYIVYRAEGIDLEENSVLMIEGHVCDAVLLLVNGELIAPKQLNSSSDFDGFGFYSLVNSSVVLNTKALKKATIDLIVENIGRSNGASTEMYKQSFKGLWQGNVTINGTIISSWTIVPFELKKQWVNGLAMSEFEGDLRGPAMFSSTLTITDEPNDTFIDIRAWGKGIVFVNGFPLGKYASIGPDFTLYLPAPFLVKGDNQIIFLEHFSAPESAEIIFTDKQIFV
ncbi:beta-galactosidase-1-like protein 2 [Anthonomus grandis grandis]|uniref:beta-galactosidase-1-like protein 2 n=1 Tax=Anthonomus grandis grandis TaxID=2921223 RepID=UPI00216512AF|nr:beta-galactosidase-1-like protein 2 [Anthonomus grandis grandis]